MLPESVIALLGRQSLRSISGGGADMFITSLGSLGPQLTARELKPCDSGGWSCDGALAPFLRASLSPSSRHAPCPSRQQYQGCDVGAGVA